MSLRASAGVPRTCSGDMYPAVPMNRNLVRFSITAAHTEAEADHAIGALQAVWRALHGSQAA